MESRKQVGVLAIARSTESKSILLGGNINYISTVAGKWVDNVVTELTEVVL